MGAPGTSPLTMEAPSVTDGSDRIIGLPTRYPTNVPQSANYIHPPIEVVIETGRNTHTYAPTRFNWQNVTLAMDGGDTTATLIRGLDDEMLGGPGEIGSEHFSHLMDDLDPDRRVRIQQSYGREATVLFQGYPSVPSMNWTDRGQTLTCLCTSEGQEILRTSEGSQVLGRRMRYDPLAAWNETDPDDVLVTALPVVFNAGNLPNRSAEAYPFFFNGYTYMVHLFTEDNAPDAAHWNYAEALRYLAFFHILRTRLSVSVSELMDDLYDLIDLEPNPDAVDPFVRLLTARPEELAVSSCNVEQAIHTACEAANLHHEVVIRSGTGKRGGRIRTTAWVGFYLRVFAVLKKREESWQRPRREMITPSVHVCAREAPFTDTTGRSAWAIMAANRAKTASLTMDRRGVSAPIILGGHKHYECTLLLRPGWLPEVYLDNETTAEGQAAAIDVWKARLAPENEFEEDSSRRPKSIYHGNHRDHHTVNRVGRYWIFPDDYRLMNADGVTSPYARANWPAALYSPYDASDPSSLIYVNDHIGGGIADAAYWVPRRRPFRDLIGRMRATDDQAPIVLINFKHTDPDTALSESQDWVEYSGQAKIDEHRAGITFEEVNLLTELTLLPDPVDDPAGELDSMLQAYIEGRFMVAVICTVRGDDRMEIRPRASGSPFTRNAFQVIDQGLDAFQHNDRRGQNSRLNALPYENDPAFEDRIDTDRLRKHGIRQAEVVAGEDVSGSVHIPFADTSYLLGDAFSGVSGLGIEFTRYPEIIRIELTNDPNAGVGTVLHLTELREAPEVGLE
jgi:hypothetical protein